MCPQYPICYRVLTSNKIVRSVKIDVGKFSSPITTLASFPESSFCHTTEISLTPASLAPFSSLPSTWKRTYPGFHLLREQVVS